MRWIAEFEQEKERFSSFALFCEHKTRAALAVNDRLAVSSATKRLVLQVGAVSSHSRPLPTWCGTPVAATVQGGSADNNALGPFLGTARLVLAGIIIACSSNP